MCVWEVAAWSNERAKEARSADLSNLFHERTDTGSGVPPAGGAGGWPLPWRCVWEVAAWINQRAKEARSADLSNLS